MRRAFIIGSSGRSGRLPFDLLRRGVPVALLWLLGGPAELLQAAEPAVPSDKAGLVNAELLVQRTERAQDCPDTVALTELVQAQAAPKAHPPELQRVDVVFSRLSGQYRVDLTMSGWREGHRTLRAEEPNCQGLTRATVVAITILLDPSATPAGTDRILGGKVVVRRRQVRRH